LEHLTVGKESIGDQFEDLTLVCGGFLEFWYGRWPWRGGREPKPKIQWCREEGRVREKRGEMAAELRNGFGFGLSHVFIIGATKGALNGPLYFRQEFYGTLTKSAPMVKT
jgi:hypothetical protein